MSIEQQIITGVVESGDHVVKAAVEGKKTITAEITEPDEITEHGNLAGLGADDHTQYHNDARGDARYFTQTQVTAALANKEDAANKTTNFAANTGSNTLFPTVKAIFDALVGYLSNYQPLLGFTPLAPALNLGDVASSAEARVNLFLENRTVVNDVDYSVTANNRYVAFVAPLTAVRFANLPAAATLNAGQMLVIADESLTADDTNYISIKANGAELINGVSTVDMKAAGGWVTLISNGVDGWAYEAAASRVELRAHVNDTANPHAVTKTQVGLGNVDNTSDLAKPISTATQTALNLKENIANKLAALIAAIDAGTTSDTTYPTTKAINDLMLLFAPNSDVQQFGASGTWVDPSFNAPFYRTPSRVFVFLVGGGGGGGSGRRGAAGSIRGGGGGGGGAQITIGEIAYNQIGDQTITIGAGGVGGASRTTNDTNGAGGTAGGITSAFGIFRALGGGAGGAGGTPNGAGGGAGGVTTILSIAGSAGGSSGAGGGAGAAGAANAGGGSSGGGAGGGITTANAQSNGGAGGACAPSWSVQTCVGGTAGAAGGGNGGAGNSVTAYNELTYASGGGGGGSSITRNAGNGGAGGYRGAGGGGGGASVNDVGNSGAGGSAQAGYAIIISEF